MSPRSPRGLLSSDSHLLLQPSLHMHMQWAHLPTRMTSSYVSSLRANSEKAFVINQEVHKFRPFSGLVLVTLYSFVYLSIIQEIQDTPLSRGRNYFQLRCLLQKPTVLPDKSHSITQLAKSPEAFPGERRQASTPAMWSSCL